MDSLGVPVLIAIAVFVYFIPILIAWKKRNAARVKMINLFLGWTFVGWVIALKMALANEKTITGPVSSQRETPEQLRLENIQRLKRILHSGELTDEECEALKERLRQS